jgi:hypothetical protein
LNKQPFSFLVQSCDPLQSAGLPFFFFGAGQSCPLGNVSLGQTQIASMYKTSRNKALTLGKQQWITHLSIAVEFPIHPKVKRLIS